MLELLLDLIHPPAWYALFIGILLGFGASIVTYAVLDLKLRQSSTQGSDASLHRTLTKENFLFIIQAWLAFSIRRKESPNDDEGDHHALLVS